MAKELNIQTIQQAQAENPQSLSVVAEHCNHNTVL